ncbi:MAG: YajD family HNH nuclease [Desulfuromonadales bacterium]|nr:YajD family HNH nuclease [Desulfuromonadales bacterium]
MSDSKKHSAEQRNRLVAEMRREQQQREAGYREQALKLYPPVCGRCAREFEGKALRELTVHHRDHNHDNNPPDGSNWELLCIYCHDHEHTRMVQEQRDGDAAADRGAGPTLSHSPFAALAEKLSNSK